MAEFNAFAKHVVSGLSKHVSSSTSMQVRGKADKLLLYGMIGGGKKPESIQACLIVLVCELDQLWQGVQMYDASKKETRDAGNVGLQHA